MTLPDDDALNLAQACVHGDVSFKTIYRLAEKGKLTLLRRPGDKRTYISRSELDAALALAPARAEAQTA